MELLFILVIMGVIGAAVTSGKGRSGAGGFFLGFLLGPIGLLICFVMASKGDHLVRESLANGELKRCTYCDEPIRPAAIRCRYCGSALDPNVPFYPAPK